MTETVFIRVPPENKVFVVPAQARTIIVPPEDKTFRVPART